MTGVTSVEIQNSAEHSVRLNMLDSSWIYDTRLPKDLSRWQGNWRYSTIEPVDPLTKERVANLHLDSGWVDVTY